MRLRTVVPVALNPPPGIPRVDEPRPLGSEGLIEITSKTRRGPDDSCARNASAPITIGPAIAAQAAAASSILRETPSGRAIGLVRIAAKRFLSSPPVTPATQTSGDSRYSLQTSRIPAA